MALRVIAVASGVAFLSDSLIESDTEECQRGNNCLDCIFYESLIICILYTEKEYASALVSESLIHESSVEVAEMDEACRAWTEPGYLCSFREFSFRIHGLIFFRSVREIRVYSICELLVA